MTGSAGRQPHRMVIMAVTSKRTKETEIHPVKSLKEHITALDAAMLVAASSAEVGAVHKLRTATRRVEAHLCLVDLLQHATSPKAIPEHASEGKAVRHRLRRVRRAAGKVRDLDVQVDAIRYDTPAKTRENSTTEIAAVRQQAKKLRKKLSHTRDGEAAKLIEVLQAEQQKLAAALRALEQAMKPASTPAVEPDVMLEHIEHWFTKQSLQELPARGRTTLKTTIPRLDENALHSFRKAAKLCRYMAESAPEGSPVLSKAADFESLQEAGGKWHDSLLLARLSRGFHGKKAELTQRFGQHSEEALAEYHHALEGLLPSLIRKNVNPRLRLRRRL